MFSTFEADLRVFGVGGGGGNALAELRRSGVTDVGLYAANTDAQALGAHPAPERLQLGPRTTKGLGAGGHPRVGYEAAQESAAQIATAARGADLVFVAVGLGGGTGTGGAPLVAYHARVEGALTVGVVTLPFSFEGRRRAAQAAQGLEALKGQVDCLLVVPNDRLLGDEDLRVTEAFERADQVLADAVRGISDLVVTPGLVNLDFADVRAVLEGGGRAVMGVGVGRGSDRALRAVAAASSSPLLADDSLQGARGVLLHFTIDPGLGLGKIHRAAEQVASLVDDDAEILFGVGVDPTLRDEVQVTLVAAGLPHERPQVPRRRALATADLLTPAERVFARPRRRNALVML